MDWVGGKQGYTNLTGTALRGCCPMPVTVASDAVKTSEGLHSLCGTPTTNLLMEVEEGPLDEDGVGYTIQSSEFNATAILHAGSGCFLLSEPRVEWRGDGSEPKQPCLGDSAPRVIPGVLAERPTIAGGRHRVAHVRRSLGLSVVVVGVAWIPPLPFFSNIPIRALFTLKGSGDDDVRRGKEEEDGTRPQSASEEAP